MKILIHASLDLKSDMLFAKHYIENNSIHSVLLPELTRYQHIRDVDGDDDTFTRIKNHLTQENLKNVEHSDLLFIINKTHRGIDNYIGGNSFMEMVIAFYLKKPIYILNPIPDGMPYTEEIKALYPIVIDNYKSFIESIK